MTLHLTRSSGIIVLLIAPPIISDVQVIAPSVNVRQDTPGTPLSAVMPTLALRFVNLDEYM